MMGTNYYIGGKICSECGEESDRRHIGKSSGGWCFSLRVYPEENITELIDWIPIFSKGPIYDEYGSSVGIDSMMSIILCRWGMRRMPEDLHSVTGPLNLRRHPISNMAKCVAHGFGTYDLIDGEFS